MNKRSVVFFATRDWIVERFYTNQISYFAENDYEIKIICKITKESNLNKIKNLKIINKNQIKKIEPNLIADYALYSKKSAIFDVNKFIKVISKKIIDQRVEIITSLKFIENKDHDFKFKDTKGKIYIFQTKYLINCSGLNSVNIAMKFNDKNDKSSLPKSNFVKGAYLLYPQKIFKHIIYSIFRPGKITERTDATPDLNGNIIFGPSVEKSNKVNWNNLRNRFYNSIKSYYPKIKKNKLKKFKYGIRPKIYYKSKSEVNDFYIKKEKNIINLLGIESPGLTSCLAIGKHVSKLVK